MSLFIGNLSKFPFIFSWDIFSINGLTIMLKIISQCDIMPHYDVTGKNNNVTSITARSIWPAVILTIMFVPTFMAAIILYVWCWGSNVIEYYCCMIVLWCIYSILFVSHSLLGHQCSNHVIVRCFYTFSAKILSWLYYQFFWVFCFNV